jgi:hypothetical protein
MTTIAERVEGNKNYQKIKGRKKLSEREASLLNSAYVVAENELSKLKVKVERKSGDARVEQQKVVTMGVALSFSEGIKSFGGFLVRPYGENRQRIPLQSHELIDTVAGNTYQQDEIIDSPVKNEPKNPDLKAATHSTAVDSLPSWPKAIVLFIEHGFSKMSPLTTAIWFLIIVSGAIAFGWAQKTYLTSTYNHVIEENKRQTSKISELEGSLKVLEGFKNEIEIKKKLIAALRL